MPLSSAARTNAIYAVAAAQPNFDKLNQAEKDQVKAGIMAMWGSADLGYIIANTQVNPTALQDPGGAAVATTGSAVAQTGTVVAPTAIVGTGTIS